MKPGGSYAGDQRHAAAATQAACPRGPSVHRGRHRPRPAGLARPAAGRTRERTGPRELSTSFALIHNFGGDTGEEPVKTEGPAQTDPDSEGAVGPSSSAPRVVCDARPGTAAYRCMAGTLSLAGHLPSDHEAEAPARAARRLICLHVHRLSFSERHITTQALPTGDPSWPTPAETLAQERPLLSPRHRQALQNPEWPRNRGQDKAQATS